MPKNSLRIITIDWLMQHKEISPKGCWIFTGCKTTAGYGIVSVGGRNGKLMYTHRLMWASIYGEIGEGLEILHKCDNPPCMNPDHLFKGTQTDNNLDKVNKGRARGNKNTGEDSGYHKLTWAKVAMIRELRLQGLTKTAIAKKFDIHRTTVAHIENGKTWRQKNAC